MSDRESYTKIYLFYGFHATVDFEKFDHYRDEILNKTMRNRISLICSADSNTIIANMGPSVWVHTDDLKERIDSFGHQYYDWNDLIRIGVATKLHCKNTNEDHWTFFQKLRSAFEDSFEYASEIRWWGAEFEVHDDLNDQLIGVLPLGNGR